MDKILTNLILRSGGSGAVTLPKSLIGEIVCVELIKADGQKESKK